MCPSKTSFTTVSNANSNSCSAGRYVKAMEKKCHCVETDSKLIKRLTTLVKAARNPQVVVGLL